MKRIVTLLATIILFALSLHAQGYTKSFPQYGFSITAPCKLSDVSAKSNSNFLVNYAGTENENDKAKFAFYQIMAFRLPAGALDYNQDQLNKMFRSFMDSNLLDSFSSHKAIRFGYEGYTGYEVQTTTNGYKQKGVFFLKGTYVIGLTVISNYNLDARFNKFTNGFKTL